MRLLIDEDVDVRLIKTLKRLGHDVRRVPSGVMNGEVLRLAQRERRIVITRDADFTNVKKYPSSRHVGIIHLAIHPPWLENLVPPVTRLLRTLSEDQVAGKVIIVDETSSRTIS